PDDVESCHSFPTRRSSDLGGEPLASDRPYTVAIPDYLLTGGDGYDMFAGQRVATGPEAGEIIVAALERYVTTRRDIAPQVDGRIDRKSTRLNSSHQINSYA